MKFFIKIPAILAIYFIVSPFGYLFSQDIENIGKQPESSLGDYVSTNRIFTFSHIDTISTSEYTGYYSGTLNYSYLGVNIPHPFFYTKRMGDYFYSLVYIVINPQSNL